MTMLKCCQLMSLAKPITMLLSEFEACYNVQSWRKFGSDGSFVFAFHGHRPSEFYSKNRMSLGVVDNNQLKS